MSKLAARLNQYERALTRLQEALSREKTDIVRDSAVKRFEIALDLAWKLVQAHLEKEAGIICRSPKECFRQAYAQGLIAYDDEWLKLVDLRNDAVHSYNEALAEKIYAELPRAATLFNELAAAVGRA